MTEHGTDVEAQIFSLLVAVRRRTVSPLDALGRLADLAELNEGGSWWEPADCSHHVRTNAPGFPCDECGQGV
jgi:hypothetical protein